MVSALYCHARSRRAIGKRALDADYTTLIVTVDVGVNGNRERNLRNYFTLPIHYTPDVIMLCIANPHWALNYLETGMPNLKKIETKDTSSIEAQAFAMSRQMDTSFNFESLKKIRDLWPYKLIVKGVVRKEDVAQCISCGADGVVLSNHGGRQLDCAVPPITILPDIAQACDTTTFIDSGFRRGSDILKALCLGADMVLIGRPMLYGLAVGGQQGVEDVIKLLKADLDKTLALIGSPTLKALDQSFLLRNE